jgi:hypothetical protein
MNAPILALVTLSATFGFAVGAMLLRSMLPPPHMSIESKELVRLGMGLIGTMTALLLGLVTASARGTFEAQDALLKTGAVNILTLDRHLARYGDETRPTRELLKEVITYRLNTTWPEQGASQGYVKPLPTETVESLANQILALEPRNDAQRWLKSEALRLIDDVLKTRWRVLESAGEMPGAFLAIVIFWLTMTFGSFGLYAPKNGIVIAVLLIAAVSVSAAMFLIAELSGPYDGLIMVSGEPLRFAVANMGQ